MLLMLSVARRGPEGDQHVRQDHWTGWRPTHMLGTKVTGKTLGLIGLGRIAQAMARKAHHGFGMKILFTDPYPPSQSVIDELQATQCADIEEVLKECRFCFDTLPRRERNLSFTGFGKVGHDETRGLPH